MANFQLDMDTMFIEFPQIKRGLLSINMTRESEIQTLCRTMNNNIYDYVGLREAFKQSALMYANESGEQFDYERQLEKLERYMTAHLICLYIYDIVQNIDESPYITHYAKLISDKLQEGNRRAGYVTTLLQATNIGQRILAMLKINTSNVGGVL